MKKEGGIPSQNTSIHGGHPDVCVFWGGGGAHKGLKGGGSFCVWGGYAFPQMGGGGERGLFQFFFRSTKRQTWIAKHAKHERYVLIGFEKKWVFSKTFSILDVNKQTTQRKAQHTMHAQQTTQESHRNSYTLSGIMPRPSLQAGYAASRVSIMRRGGGGGGNEGGLTIVGWGGSTFHWGRVMWVVEGGEELL